MTLVHVEDLWHRVPGRPGVQVHRTGAADAQQDLLLDAVVLVAAVQPVRGLPQEVVVRLVVGVQQQQRHPAHLSDPDPSGQLAATWHRHDDGQLLTVGTEHPVDRQTLRVVRGVVLLLPAVRGQRLPEVPEPVQQPDPDDRHTQIGGGLQVVTGQDPEAAGIVRQHLGDAELHREVRDGGGQVLTTGDLVLVPPRIGEVMIEIVGQVVHPRQEGLVDGELLQAGHRHGSEQLEGVTLELGPEPAVDIGEEILARRMPGPPEVADQRTKRLQRLWQLRAHGETSEGLHNGSIYFLAALTKNQRRGVQQFVTRRRVPRQNRFSTSGTGSLAGAACEKWAAKPPERHVPATESTEMHCQRFTPRRSPATLSNHPASPSLPQACATRPTKRRTVAWVRPPASARPLDLPPGKTRPATGEPAGDVVAGGACQVARQVPRGAARVAGPELRPGRPTGTLAPWLDA